MRNNLTILVFFIAAVCVVGSRRGGFVEAELPSLEEWPPVEVFESIGVFVMVGGALIIIMSMRLIPFSSCYIVNYFNSN